MAVRTKNELVANINSELSDNLTGQISPYDVRHNLLDIVDSLYQLSSGDYLVTANFSTPSSGTTRAGVGTIENLGSAGYYSNDNTAIGYHALKSNYQGSKNTALGSESLNCNIYGENNVGLGFSSLSANTTGFGNVGIGSYTLYRNTVGQFNVAVGHSAGYYLDNNSEFKLVIASHPIDSGYICNNPLGSGLQPLVYGDLSGIKLGIGVRTLHNSGVLQVSGDITPYRNNESNLGNTGVYFHKAFLNSGIVFPVGSIGYENNKLYSNLDINPRTNNTQNLGELNNRWAYGYFENIYVSGTATVNSFIINSNTKYLDKTLYLASSGGPNPSGYLSDENLNGAGLIIKASGSGYLRDYELLFRPSGSNSISCLEANNPYSKSSWNSNISFYIASGCYLGTQRVVSDYDLALITDQNCYGFYLKDNHTYLSRGNILDVDPNSTSGRLAGVGDINLFSNSGQFNDYYLTLGSIESGVSVTQRFLTGVKKRLIDVSNNNKDKLQGFELKYIDDSSAGIVGSMTDRFIIGSYNVTSQMINAVTLMKNNNEGIFGISNINPGVESILPKTAFNIRTTGDAVARISTENAFGTAAALQLLGSDNCLKNGIEFLYKNGSGITDINTYANSGQTLFMRIHDSGRLGLMSSGITNATLTIGHSGISGYFAPSISLVASNLSGVFGSIVPNSGYGKIYVTKVPYENWQQSSDIYFLDDSGNAHQLTNNKYNVDFAPVLYTDGSYNNTFGGYYCPSGRIINASLRHGNTAIGSKAVTGLTSGDFNSVFGYGAGSGITNGNANTVFGALSATAITSGYNNIVIGTNILNNTSGYINNNIIIGNSGLGSGLKENYKFLLGNGNIVLLNGTLGPSNGDKNITLPSGGNLYINDGLDLEKLHITNNNIEYIDTNLSNRYPVTSLNFKFTASGSNNLIEMNHFADPMSNSPTYQSPTTPRPFVEINGDLKLRGAIRFADTTSLDSASFLDDVVQISGIQSILSSLIREGYAQAQINAPSSPSSPTSGSVVVKDSNWSNSGVITVYNRDPSLIIHPGAYVVSLLVNNQYRPIWVSNTYVDCRCCD